MAEAVGEQTVLLLLRLLPNEAVDAVLQRLPPEAAGRLRTHLQSVAAQASPQEVDDALTQFFDLMRIAERYPALSPQPGGTTPSTAAPASTSADTPASSDPVQQLRSVPPAQLARVIQNESVAAIAVILSALEPAVAGQVLARLPESIRPEVAVRITKVGLPNPLMLRHLARVVIDKCRQMAEMPTPPTPEEMIAQLADMIRALPRAERMPVVRKMETIDPDLAAKVLERLTRIEDLAKIPDRQLQGLLAKLDMKTLATALKNAPEAVQNKISANLSSRARQVLQEEMEFLGDVPSGRIKEAQAKILAVVVKAEEAGEIVLEE
jgi:flagellar motor switch protein FliG